MIEFGRVETRLAEGAPLDLLPDATAPIAPEPLVPEESTPAKAITVSEEETIYERLALTEMLLRAVGKKARQISAVPFCAWVLCTRAQVKSPPETLTTDVESLEANPVEMKASNSSPFDVVENEGEVITELAVGWSCRTCTSIVMGP